MHCTDISTPTARKTHRCTSCGESIEAGQKYAKWVSFDDSAFTNKMHPECLAAHQKDAGQDDWEYSPYDHQRGKADMK